ncbi:Methionine import ATP-binding protein MetN [Saezia sanguinis]|uniref:Cell division ATP-binding protein FtsE n=1 Tax=Saezia sanguinis TaxID=1965230 RepID=A0A433SAX5_9BURK|nr:ATP-binding cassette domain-containing protein [Saezia sanguinis]RUS65891.1 Methionine import ATP-binding protein MetN [Saezia sanguinis]
MSNFTQALQSNTAPGGAAVVLRHLRKIYQSERGHLHALNDVNLEINAGEIFGIIGRSGAGKSTLVRCINLLEQPTSGEVWVGKQNMTQLNAQQLRVARRRIGMIFQHFNLLSSRTVFENVALPLELVKMPRAEISKRVVSLLELVGLTENANKYVAQISGGQKQRVGIARALANQPQVLLSDEATSALDPETTRSTLALLKQVNRELGVTIIMITHQMEVVQRVCDRVAVIDHGVVVEEGMVRDVFGYPKTDTTKSLVGEATGQELPKETVNQILSKAGPDTRIWQITGHQPDVLTQLVKQFGLDVAFVQALVEDYQGIPLGSLLMQVTGPQDARDAARNWAASAGIEVEEIRHVQ